MAILMEILRLEPVAAMVARRVHEPDMNWNAMLGSYELRNADISCDTSAG